MFAWIADLGFDYNLIREKFPVEIAFPFSSETKRSSVIVKYFYIEQILPDGRTKTMNAEDTSELVSVVDEKVSRGLRCIGLAELKDFVCVLIAAMKDPLREAVRDSVRRCQRSGIVVRMVTGDHPKTASFIADECRIRPLDREDLLVLTGDEFRAMSDEKQREVLPKLRVLARSTPQDKEKLVCLYMEQKEVLIFQKTVAVTGDGANDALALKKANVGLAMGIQGTDVAKEAADIIIIDDSFSSIVKTVMWGRSVYDNIRKFVQFQLTINAVALIVSFIGALINYEDFPHFALPMSPVQLIWVNVIMDTAAAMAFSTEQPTEELLERKPYRKDSFLINFSMWKSILGHSFVQVIILLAFVLPKTNPIGFVIFNLSSDDQKHLFMLLRTCVFNTFVWFQIFNSLNCRKINDGFPFN